MDMKKFVLAVVVVFVIAMATNFLVHGMLLLPTYEQLQSDQNTFRASAQMDAKMWIMWVAWALVSLMFVWVYLRGMENKPWVGQAIRYAIVIWLFVVVPATLDQYVLYRIPYTLALTWMAVGGVQVLLASLATAAICKKAPAAA